MVSANTGRERGIPVIKGKKRPLADAPVWEGGGIRPIGLRGHGETEKVGGVCG